MVFLNSCYKEVVVESDIQKDVFDLSMMPETLEFVHNSRDTVFSIQDPELSLSFNEREVALDKMRLRGVTTLKFRRKSFSVFLDHPIALRKRDGNGIKSLSSFKLISLSMDYTYINNRIAFGILEQNGLMPLFYKYVELRINGETQGIYFLVEDPEQFYMEQGSEYILRRGYHSGIADSEYEPNLYSIPREAYENRFREVYAQMPQYSGEVLYETINQRIDLNQYFGKMGIDYLLRNGDSTDEVYFYSSLEQDAIKFKIIPWDYDDIFSSYPHEIGRSWGTGKIYGERIYNSQQDVFDEIGDKLIFSIEDDLDYTIARDTFLYERYKSTLARLFQDIEKQDISALFEEVKQELTPFYNEEAIILQSQYDEVASSLELWQSNMLEKQTFLENRLKEMKTQLNKVEN